MKLSDEQIQRLNDAGFKWCVLVKNISVWSAFAYSFANGCELCLEKA